MLLEIAAAAMIAAAPAPAPTSTVVTPPSPAATAAPVASATPVAVAPNALTTPLREVVYNVTSSTLFDDINESYGGGETANAPSSTDIESRNGTVTVDVMAKFEDGVLGIRVFEHWKVPPLPQRFMGGVAPDGTVEFPQSTIDPVTIELLPYFATQFAPPGNLAPGTHWSVVKTYDKSVVSTDYTVTAVGTASITIHKLTTIKALGSETIDGTIAYNPSSFVPLSGKIRVKRTDIFANGQRQQTVDLTFDRVSDTFDAATTP
jgi:hypothetical protein